MRPSSFFAGSPLEGSDAAHAPEQHRGERQGEVEGLILRQHHRGAALETEGRVIKIFQRVRHPLGEGVVQRLGRGGQDEAHLDKFRANGLAGPLAGFGEVLQGDEGFRSEIREGV